MSNFRKVPWITEGAREYLKKFLNNNKNIKVLEFGCGGSTIWLDSRVNELISIDHSKKWTEKIKQHCINAKIKLIPRPYNTICEDFQDNYFDLIIIDGRDRVKCLYSSLSKLKKNGIIILDNSEREKYNEFYKVLNGWRLEYTQEKPDDHGFVYKNWKTTIWYNKDLKDL